MNEFKLGWKIVLVAMLGVGFNGANILLYTIGALAPQLSQEFGWSHGSIQLASLFSIGTVVLALPAAAYLSDKYGVRRLTLCSIVLTSLCVVLHAFLSKNIALFYTLAVLTALAFAGSLPLTWTKMVTSWFDRRLGLALGLTLLGTGLGGAILKPTTAGLIAEFGWRGAYVALGVIPLVVVLPLAIAWFREPKGKKVTAVHLAEDEAAIEPHTPVNKPFKDWRFWAIAIAYIPIGFAVAGLITNMEVILASGGADAAQVVTAGTTFGVSVVIGRIIGGYMLDKYNPGIVGSTLIMSLSIAFILLSQPDLGVSMTLLAISLAGFGTGVEFDVLSYLIQRIFGPDHYAKIFSYIMALLYIGSAFGPVLFGSTYDKTGSFGPVLIPVAVGVFIGSVLIGSLSGSLKNK